MNGIVDFVTHTDRKGFDVEIEKRYSTYLGKICGMICTNLASSNGLSGAEWGERRNGLARWVGNITFSRPTAETRDFILREDASDNECFIFRIFHMNKKTLKRPIHVVLKWEIYNELRNTKSNTAAVQVFVWRDNKLETDFMEDSEKDVSLIKELDFKSVADKEMLLSRKITYNDVKNDRYEGSYDSETPEFSRIKMLDIKSEICNAIFRYANNPENNTERKKINAWFDFGPNKPPTALCSDSTMCLLQRLEALGLPE